MSTRVLTRKAAAAVQPIQWPSVHAMEQSVEAGGEVERGAELEHQLRQRDARIAALERELAQVNQESQQRIQEAAEAARKEGESAARRTADNELQTEIAKIRRMMNDVVLSGTMLRRQAEEDMVRLSIAIARRILHREISLDPEALLGLVKAALSKIEQREIHQIRIHPDTVPILQRVLEHGDIQKRIEIAADVRADRGCLLIETSRGQLDASVETQLQEIQRGFADIVGSHG